MCRAVSLCKSSDAPTSSPRFADQTLTFKLLVLLSKFCCMHLLLHQQGLVACALEHCAPSS